MFNCDEEIIFLNCGIKRLRFTDMQDIASTLLSVNFILDEFSMK